MCHYGTEGWEKEVSRLIEEDPEEEFKTETEESEATDENEKPVPADD